MTHPDDQLLLKYQRPKTVVVYGWESSAGSGSDLYLGNYRDECFVAASPAGRFPNGAAATRLAGETALWGYTYIRQKRYYWQDKKQFMKRIYRTVNISVWQKTRETGFEDGLACSLAVVIIGLKNVWIGNVGDTHVYVFRDANVIRQTSDDVDAYGHLRKMIGVKRYGLLPQYIYLPLTAGDTVLAVTGGITKQLTAEDLAAYIHRDMLSSADCKHAAAEIVARCSAQETGAVATAAMVVRRIPNAEAGRVSHLSTEFG